MLFDFGTKPKRDRRIVSFFEQILFHFDFLKRKYSAKFYCWQMQYHKIGWIFKSRITNNSMLSFAALNIYKILNIKASNKICVILLNTRCATEYNMIPKIMILPELLYFSYLLDFNELNNVFYVIRNESLGRNMPYFKWWKIFYMTRINACLMDQK